MRERDDRVLAATRAAIALIRSHLNLHFSVRLWDGTVEPLGDGVVPGLTLQLNSPGVLPSLLRWPSLDRLIRHYAHGRIDLEGGTIVDFGRPFTDKSLSKQVRQISKVKLARTLWPVLIAKGDHPDTSRRFEGDVHGARRAKQDNRQFIKFHYDIGNDFYRLFLDPEMQYSCAYYPTWDTSLADAQVAKLDMICRKLRLKPGDHLLDIGCGWGGLLCHAATHYGVTGLGVTLADEQIKLARQKAASLGLSDRLTFELKDYNDLKGRFDKIASIGMYEHIGIKAIPGYFSKIRTLLKDDGLFLNHAIAHKAKKRKRKFADRPEQKALQKYIFPGGELTDVGYTIRAAEQTGFETQDVEGWRPHYERTTRLWCERLTARRAEAEALVGPETYRIWVAYLGGCSLAFRRGSATIYQVLFSRTRRGPPPLPPTRADLYAERPAVDQGMRAPGVS